MTTIGTSAFYENAIANLNKLSTSTGTLQQQISTGNRLTHSYDDPLAAAQMRQMQAADTLSAAVTTNTTLANTTLTQTDSTLSQLSSVISNIQTLATQGATDTMNAADKANIGKEIGSYYNTLVTLMNTKDAYGNYLFSGSNSTQAYTQDASGNATYTGGTAPGAISLGGSMSVTPSVTGPEVLNFTNADGSSGDLLSTVKALSDGLQNGTLTSDQMNASGGTFDQLNSALDQLTTTQTVIGSRLSLISTAQTIQTAASTSRATVEQDVGGTNLTTAAAQLTQQMTILQASQASFSKLASLSLFTYLS
ncbi:MAG: flagellar biosynthesis protein FlgL [Sphingomonadales bacterium]|nr:flagellar biosynthesis protein FlgL [Sphingomonadales bacterium]MDE2169736.1 flagellar biosynthesis protein FlgL [Sphingomonadales bacterium]